MSAPEAELALIGCMLINPSCVPGVVEIATGRDIFLARENAAIASAICTVYEQTGTVAAAAVIQRLRDDGKWDDVLTTGRMDTAVTHADSGVNWEFYARTLCDKADRRKLAAELVTAERRLLHDESLDAWRASVMEKLMGHQGAGSRDVDAYSAARAVLERFKASEPTNVKTGFARFDDRFGGLPIGGLVTILGTPGSGKSTFALNLAVNLARKERWAGRVFSYEMPAFRLATSVLCNISGVSIYGYQREGRQPDLQRMGQLESAAGELRGMDLAFVDDCLNHEEIAARVAMYARKGVKFVVVDYIQNLPAANPTDDSEYSRISDACRTCQRICRNFGVTTIMVSQVTGQASRSGRAPRAGDGIGSSAIEQVSDMIISVHRPGRFESNDEGLPPEIEQERLAKVELHVQKNKYGPIGMVPMAFHGHLSRFE